jgi:DNA-binding CsgD family transcriptional regulator
MGRAIELHRSTGDDPALARALTFAVLGNEHGGRPEVADACIAEALAILESYPPSGDLAFAVSQQAWLSMMRGGDHVRAIELADQAISLAEETGDELTMIHSLNTKGTSTYVRGDPDGFRLLEEARRRAEQAGNSFEETRALANMLSTAAERRELERASDLAQQAIGTAIRYEIDAKYVRAKYAEVLLWRGEWVAAEDLSAQVLGSPSGRTPLISELMAGRVLGRLQARRGRPQAQDTLDHTWSLAEVNAEMRHLLPTTAALAEHMWLTDEADPDRIARFREVLDEGLRLEFPWDGGDLAFWLWKLGELPATPEGIAEPYRLVIEGKPVEAATIWEAKGIPYERALALMDGDETTQLEALEIYGTLGATSVAAKLRKTLRDQGVSVPRGLRRETRRHAAGLTARQTEVLALLAEDMSNLDIADQLFLSPRTVEHHVAAVMSKLNASTRHEAVVLASEQGLLNV